MKKSANDGEMEEGAGTHSRDAAGAPSASLVFEPDLIALLRELDLSGPATLKAAENQVECDQAAEESASHRSALDRFSTANYFEAHEHWESIWRNRPLDSPARHAFQALIRLCAAGVKFQEGNFKAYTHHLKGAQNHLVAALASPLGEPARWDSWKRLLVHLKTLPLPTD